MAILIYGIALVIGFIGGENVSELIYYSQKTEVIDFSLGFISSIIGLSFIIIGYLVDKYKGKNIQTYLFVSIIIFSAVYLFLVGTYVGPYYTFDLYSTAGGSLIDLAGHYHFLLNILLSIGPIGALIMLTVKYLVDKHRGIDALISKLMLLSIICLAIGLLVGMFVSYLSYEQKLKTEKPIVKESVELVIKSGKIPPECKVRRYDILGSEKVGLILTCSNKHFRAWVNWQNKKVLSVEGI